jgi:hypothetical protein
MIFFLLLSVAGCRGDDRQGEFVSSGDPFVAVAAID